MALDFNDQAQFGPVAEQPIMNTYVPLPFKELSGMAEQLQGRADKAQQQISDYQDDLLKVQALPGHDTNYVKQKSQELDNLATQYRGKNLADPSVYNELHTKLRSLQRDPGLKEAQSAFDQHQEQMKRVQKAEDEGNYKYAEELDYEYNKKYKDYTHPQGVGFEGEKLRSDFSAGYNLDKEREERFNNMPILKSQSLVSLQNLKATITYSGISEDRIDERSRRVARDYINSGPGKQELQQYKKLYETNLGQLTKANGKVMTPFEFVLNNLIDTGLEKEGISKTSNIGSIYNKLKQDQEPLYNATESGTTEITDRQQIPTPDFMKGISFNKFKGINPVFKGGFKDEAVTVQDPITGGVSQTSYRKTEEDKELNKKRQDFIDDLSKNNPSLKGKAPEEVWNSYLEAQQENSRVGLPVEYLPPHANDYYEKQIFKGDLTTRSFTTAMSKNNLSGLQSFNELAKNLNLDKKDLEKQMHNASVNGVTAMGSEPGQFETTIKDHEGKDNIILVNGSKQQKAYYTRSWLASQFEREGKTGTTPVFRDPITGIKYSSSTFIDKDSPEAKNKFRTLVYEYVTNDDGSIKVEDGKPVISNIYANPDKLQEEDHIRWMNSKYFPKIKQIKNPVGYDNSPEEEIKTEE